MRHILKQVVTVFNNFQCILGKIWHTCTQMCPAQLFPILKWSCELGVSLCHCLDNQVSLLFIFSTLWTCYPSETLSCFPSLLSGSIPMSTLSSHPAHTHLHILLACSSAPGFKQLTCVGLYGRFGFMKRKMRWPRHN